MTDWPERLDVATLGVEPGSYDLFRSSPPGPLTLEDLEYAIREALEPRRGMVPVELHHSGCRIWSTRDRMECSCSPGWAYVPEEP